MPNQEIREHPFSTRLNTKELHYRETIQPHEPGYDTPSKWIARLQVHRKIVPFLVTVLKFHGKILELGAGSCWLGSELSKIQAVEKVYCLDISKHILSNVAPAVLNHLQADPKKIQLVIGDFNELYFPDQSFDFIVMDQTLHHIPQKDFHAVMAEIRRVLKDIGKVVAVREPFLTPTIFYSNYKRKTFGLHERKYGVTENIFTKKQWADLLEKSGFKVQFVRDALRPTEYSPLRNLIKKIILTLRIEALYLYFRPNFIIICAKNE